MCAAEEFFGAWTSRAEPFADQRCQDGAAAAIVVDSRTTRDGEDGDLSLDRVRTPPLPFTCLSLPFHILLETRGELRVGLQGWTLAS